MFKVWDEKAFGTEGRAKTELASIVWVDEAKLLAFFPESVHAEARFFAKMVGEVASMGVGKSHEEMSAFRAAIKNAFLATGWSETFLWSLAEAEMKSYSDGDSFRKCFHGKIDSYHCPYTFPSYGADTIVADHANFSLELAKKYLASAVMAKGRCNADTFGKIVSRYRSDDEIVAAAFKGIVNIKYIKEDTARKLMEEMAACLETRQYAMVQESVVQTVMELNGAFEILGNPLVLGETIGRFVRFPHLHRFMAGNPNLSEKDQETIADRHLGQSGGNAETVANLARNPNLSEKMVRRLGEAKFSEAPYADSIGLHIAANPFFGAELLLAASEWANRVWQKALVELLPHAVRNPAFSQAHFDAMFKGNESFAAISAAYACKNRLDGLGIAFEGI